MRSGRSTIAKLCVVALVDAAILATPSVWRDSLVFDDRMAVSNAVHVIRTARWSEGFFRSRIRPMVTLALLPPVLLERGLTVVTTRSPSDAYAREWHIYGGAFVITRAWAVALTAAVSAFAATILPATVPGTIGWLAGPLCTALFARHLTQPITQSIGWTLSIGLVLVATREFTRPAPLRWWALSGLFACGLLAGQDVSPVVIAVGLTAIVEQSRRGGFRVALSSLAAAAAAAAAIISAYFLVFLQSSPLELVDFIIRDIPYTHKLMGYPPNTLAYSASLAGDVLAWAGAPLAVLASLLVLLRTRLQWRSLFLVIWLIAGFVLPAMLPFVFVRFFTGLIVPAVLLTLWASVAVHRRIWRSEVVADGSSCEPQDERPRPRPRRD